MMARSQAWPGHRTVAARAGMKTRERVQNNA